MTFKVTDGDKTTEYQGFRRLTPNAAEAGKTVVLAWTEDGYEVWEIDGKDGLDSLRQYYDKWMEGLDVPFTILNVAGFDV